MHFQLNLLRKQKKTFDASVPFTLYGLLKYFLCLSAFTLSFVLLLRISVFLTPLSVIIFYLAEVQLLFLFPLLIDGVNAPLLSSVKQTAKLGTVSALLIVMPIAFYMLTGLLNLRDPFRNWHIGSLAILILYLDETGDRI